MLKDEIIHNIYRSTYQKKFSQRAGELIFTYIEIMYASAYPSVSLQMALGLLYGDITEAKKYHKIERTKFDSLLRLFADQLYICFNDFYNSKTKHDSKTFSTILQSSNIILANHAPSIIEPKYDIEERL